ncbi:MAG: arsenate reductase ArsC [Anaerolineaceae bacterium]|nr:arsenate reductase ArsC [Anaerolineaceae bacterium]
MAKRRVLILCGGNSCRSQMAEAMINHWMGEDWNACSAGVTPAERVNPMTIEALEELGIHHIGKPKGVESFRDQTFDLVITVCDEAAENCPVWLGSGKKTHIGFRDPAKAEGSIEERLVVFRQVRDEIREKLLGYLRTI